ncbi:MAG TPA: hypothetical protein VHN59_09940 [Chitinophagaceae bacterium]|nr:hypothetical protein [Chitinophagaceae bacterium]
MLYLHLHLHLHLHLYLHLHRQLDSDIHRLYQNNQFHWLLLSNKMIARLSMRMF